MWATFPPFLVMHIPHSMFKFDGRSPNDTYLRANLLNIK